jgi:hypothetical protein
MNVFSKMDKKKGKKSDFMKMEKKSTRLIILTTNKMENTLNFIKME